MISIFNPNFRTNITIEKFAELNWDTASIRKLMQTLNTKIMFLHVAFLD